ncbi:Fe(2+) transporter permease subunit FeoB [Methylocystis sp. 9N]|uniref:Ferrous iron transport protein B n=1 Tax=Methylocystis borbori TaxID=3118750 RepID=A0ABU7XEM2_9HYPH
MREGDPKPILIGIVGNPNCGKSTLFNVLTGARQEVGNWPGVTVEKKSGRYRYDGNTYEMIDLPGVYSLGATIDVSEDERIARDFVLSGDARLIVNIVDASNLERNLYLTAQLLEMGAPMAIAVNMMDIAKRRGIVVDTEKLSRELGCPAIPIIATRGIGVSDLMAHIADLAERPRPPLVTPHYGEAVEAAIARLEPLLAENGSRQPHWRALKLIEGDPVLAGEVGGHLESETTVARDMVAQAFGEDPDIVIADARFGFVTGIVERSATRPREASRTLSDRIDHIVLNRFLGIPIFLMMMYVMFIFTIRIGGAFIDFFEQATGALLVDGGRLTLERLGLPQWLVALLAEGVGGGVQTVATFIPIIGLLYLFLSTLEDSGYMARAAFVMDRAMRAVGLPGKSFVLLIVGFGCNVPAIMATRTLESRHDRILTIMMAPFMSCGARLPVYALFAAVFFPASGQNVVFLLYLIGILFAVGTGFLLKNTVLRGEASPFIMELPPYHMPTVSTVLLRAWDRLKAFVFRCSRVIIPIVVLLSFLNTIGADGSFGNQNSEKSALSAIGRTMVPAFEPMGMTRDNWPAAVGVFTGVLAKEVVIGTLNALYSQLGARAAGEGGESKSESADVGKKLVDAFETVPQNLKAVLAALTDPLGLDVSFIQDTAATATKLKVQQSAFSAMAARFDGPAGAFAYLLMILLYIPCVAAMGAIYQEIGWRWTIFSAIWNTGIGWCAAVIFYQAARFDRSPGTSVFWIAACLAALLAAMAALRVVGSGAAKRRNWSDLSRAVASWPKQS